jgi:uncharacterized membrane protein YcgQ (UPF0703/DUF1980 family)
MVMRIVILCCIAIATVLFLIEDIKDKNKKERLTSDDSN